MCGGLEEGKDGHSVDFWVSALPVERRVSSEKAPWTRGRRAARRGTRRAREQPGPFHGVSGHFKDLGLQGRERRRKGA